MSGRRERGVLWGALAALAVVLVAAAWVSDDAWITFRTLTRLWEGDGLTWNPGERVQAFTHPLWLFVLAPCVGVTGEYFFTSIAVSLAVTAVSVGLWLRVAAAPMRVVIVAALFASRSFVDFSASGLENPLLALVLVAMTWVATWPAGERRDLVASLLLSAAFLTRADAVLLVTPLWLVLSFTGRRPSPRAVVLGAVPAVAWELFSYAYFGSWVPNTAIAKLNLEVPAATVMRAGVAYLGDSLARDPISLGVVALAVVVAIRGKDVRVRALALGAVLSLLYVVRIGGDFMSGRFVFGPFVVALLAVTLGVERAPAWAALACLGLSVVWPTSPLRSSSPRFGEGVREAAELTGVVDERAYYFPTAGLVPVLRTGAKSEGECAGRVLAASDRPGEFYGEIGQFGFFAGRKIVLDVFSLTDPLLARIPYRTEKFRAGHYPRPLPAGYFETRLSGQNQLEDAGLRAAWDDLSLVLRGELFSRERWAAISRLNGGAHDEAFQRAARTRGVPYPLPQSRCE